MHTCTHAHCTHTRGPEHIHDAHSATQAYMLKEGEGAAKGGKGVGAGRQRRLCELYVLTT